MLKGIRNGVQQLLLSEGLGQKVHSAGFHSSNGRWYVSMSGEKDNRNSNPHFRQPGLKLEAASTWKAQVQYQAGGSIREAGAQ